MPHRYVGQRLTVKADAGAVTVYERVTEVVSYPRSWRRGQTFGAERFEKLLAEQRPAARRSQAQQRLVDSLDGLCSRELLEAYLRDLADTDRSLARQISELLELIRQYGPDIVAGAIEKASAARALGADYVANIVRQQQLPRRPQPPVPLRDPQLRDLVTDPISLLAYDAFILDSGKEHNDLPRTETAAVNLAAMCHQIEQTIAEAAAKNMSVTATLEWLADMELEARTGRAIDSPLQVLPFAISPQH